MTDFILLYKGEISDMSQWTEEQSRKVMDAWKAWMGEIGSALKDIGSPMSNGYSLVDNGTSGKPADLSGYSIIEAENLESAKKLLKNHPFLIEGKGQYSVEIFELSPAPF